MLWSLHQVFTLWPLSRQAEIRSDHNVSLFCWFSVCNFCSTKIPPNLRLYTTGVYYLPVAYTSRCYMEILSHIHKSLSSRRLVLRLQNIGIYAIWKTDIFIIFYPQPRRFVFTNGVSWAASRRRVYPKKTRKALRLLASWVFTRFSHNPKVMWFKSHLRNQ